MQIKHVIGLNNNAIWFKTWFKWMIECKLDWYAIMTFFWIFMQCNKVKTGFKWVFQSKMDWNAIKAYFWVFLQYNKVLKHDLNNWYTADGLKCN